MSKIVNPFGAYLGSEDAPMFTDKPVVTDDIANEMESAILNVVDNPDRLSSLLGFTYSVIHNT